MIKIKKCGMYWLPIIIFLSLLYIKYFNNGGIILGGEGNFIFDFQNHKEVYGYTWFNIGYGWPNVIPNPVGLNHLFLILLNEITSSYRIVNFSLIAIIFIMPYTAMCLFLSDLGVEKKIVIAISTLYVINPFTISYLQSFNQWNNLCLAIIPFLYFIINRFHCQKLIILISVGILTRLLSFSLYNPPTAGIVIISLIICPFILGFNHKKSLILIILSLSGFIIFNIDWLSVMIYSILNGITQEIFTKDFSAKWVSVVSGGGFNALYEVLTLNVLQNKNGENFGYYSSTIVSTISIIITIVVIIGNIINENRRNLILTFSILFVIFLTKGNALPFGEVYSLLIEYFPYFYIFKTPTEKFGILYIFLIMLGLAVTSKKIIKIRNIVVLVAIILYSYPIIWGNALASKYTVDTRVVTRNIKINKEHWEVITYLNKHYRDQRILTYPGSGNYQSLIRAEDEYYSGLDFVLNNAHIKYIYPEIDSELFKLPINKTWIETLRSKNISAIIYNENEEYWFGSSYDGDKRAAHLLLDDLLPNRIIIGSYHIWDLR